MTWAGVVSVSANFAWLGIVVGISIIEAPLKFKAPGITLALGLGIGRLVFGVVTKVEAALLAIVAISAAWVPAPVGARAALLSAVAVVLAVQLFVLRPALDSRAQVIIAGGTPPGSQVHVAYIAAEGIKIVLLVALGIVLARGGA